MNSEISTHAYLLPSANQFLVYAWKNSEYAKRLTISVKECKEIYPSDRIYEAVHKIAKERFMEMEN